MDDYKDNGYADLSRSAKKRAVVVLENLTKDILALNHSELKLLGLGEDVMDQIIMTKKIKSHGAQRRQLRYLARVIQNLDVEQLNKIMLTLNS